jgi:universal stress protein A
MAAEQVRSQVKAVTQVCVGNPARAIVQTARDLPADLIVIATHGRTGLKHVLLGSVAEHVVQRAPCPVLIVRENEYEILPS